MQHLCPSDVGVSRALTISAGPSPSGPRFGGAAPEGVSPSDKGLVYLVTLPWSSDGKQEASIFVRADDDFTFGDSEEKLLSDHAELLVHAPSRRGRGDRHASGLSAHPLSIGPERREVKSPDDIHLGGMKGHKVGGSPVLVRSARALEKKVASLMKRDYRLYAQLAFPMQQGDADVSGDWLFGDGNACFFVDYDRETLALRDFVWFFQF